MTCCQCVRCCGRGQGCDSFPLVVIPSGISSQNCHPERSGCFVQRSSYGVEGSLHSRKEPRREAFSPCEPRGHISDAPPLRSVLCDVGWDSRGSLGCETSVRNKIAVFLCALCGCSFSGCPVRRNDRGCLPPDGPHPYGSVLCDVGWECCRDLRSTQPRSGARNAAHGASRGGEAKADQAADQRKRPTQARTPGSRDSTGRCFWPPRKNSKLAEENFRAQLFFSQANRPHAPHI